VTAWSRLAAADPLCGADVYPATVAHDDKRRERAALTAQIQQRLAALANEDNSAKSGLPGLAHATNIARPARIGRGISDMAELFDPQGT
jgi:hypothetical protein